MYMANIIKEGYAFIIENLDNIILMFLFIIIGFIYVVLNNITFIPNGDVRPKTTKVVVYETFTSNNDDDNDISPEHAVKEDDTCERLKGDSSSIESYCENLHPKLCKQKECCVLGKENDTGAMKCVAGSRLGPTYHTQENGDPINFDYYYYQGKCYGEGCSTKA